MAASSHVRSALGLEIPQDQGGALDNCVPFDLVYPVLQIALALAHSALDLLDDDGLAHVDVADDMMHHDACAGDLALLKRVPRPPDRIGAVELARQRRVQVDDGHVGTLQRTDEGRGEDVHPTRAHDQVRAGDVGEDDLRQVDVVLLARSFEARLGLGRFVLVGDQVVVGGGDVGLRGPRQTVRLAPVGDDVRDARIGER